MKSIALAFAVLALSTAAAHAEVRISINTSLADRALALVCTSADVNEAEVRASPLVQAQVEHNRGLIETATMDAYVEALRALSACQAPATDTFGVAAIIAAPDVFRAKVAAIRARQDEMAARAAAMISPYLPPGTDFTGEAVLAVPYFSCGGFSRGSLFFIDIACLDEDLNKEADVLTLMIAHETYHAVQAQIFFPFTDDIESVHVTEDAFAFLFASLLLEGSAEYIAQSTNLPANGGPLTELNRHFARDNSHRPRTNYRLLTILFNYIANADNPRGALETAYGIAFTGSSYQQLGYYVGSGMAGDIERDWGRDALICVMRLPPEQFALAHDAVATARGEERLRLGPEAIEAAQRVVARRGGAGFETCRRA